jgi:hypothetical protein
MSKVLARDIPTHEIAAHPAVQAWESLTAERPVPQAIESLKLSKKSAVYRLTGAGPGGSAIIAKKCPRTTGSIERLIYEECLPTLPVSVPQSYGFLEDSENPDYCWLFLEDASGQEYSLQNAEHRKSAAVLLGMVHACCTNGPVARRLPDRGAGHYLELLRSSRATALEHLSNPVLMPEDLATLRGIASQLDLVESRWHEVEAFCQTIPRTLVHGDLVVKNVGLRMAPDGLALLAFDWENGGWGVPAADLCQFLGRTLSPDLDAYSEVLKRAGRHLEPGEIQQLAQYGRIFRVLETIGWDASRMMFESYAFVAKPMSRLRSYERRMAEALSQMGWIN